MHDTRTSRRLLAAALAVLLAAAPASAAATVRFFPELEVGHSWISDAQFTGASVGSSETYSTAAVLLPLEALWEKGSLRLNYRPELFRFTELEELDRVDQTATFALTQAPKGGRGSFAMSLGYDRSQNQTPGPAGGLTTVFFVPRADREVLLADAELIARAGTHWSWTFGAAGSTHDYEPVEADAPISLLAFGIDDQTALTGRFGPSRRFAERLELGVEYRYSRYEFEVAGLDEISALVLRGRGGLSPTRTLLVDLGAYQQLREAAPGFAARPTLESTDALLRVEFRERFVRGVLRALAERRPSTSGVFATTAPTNQLLAQWVHDDAHAWVWGVYGSATVRESDPLDVLGRVRVLSTGGSIERRWADVFAVRLGGHVSEQDAGGPGQTLSSATVALVVYPNRRPRTTTVDDLDPAGRLP